MGGPQSVTGIDEKKHLHDFDLQADVNYEIKNINAISFQSSAHKGKIKNKQKAFRCHLDRQIEQQFSPPLPYKVKINSKLIEL